MLLQQALSTPVVAAASPSAVRCVIGAFIFMQHLVSFPRVTEWSDMYLIVSYTAYTQFKSTLWLHPLE